MAYQRAVSGPCTYHTANVLRNSMMGEILKKEGSFMFDCLEIKKLFFFLFRVFVDCEIC